MSMPDSVFSRPLHCYVNNGPRFMRFVYRRFMEDNALGSASALAYTTLLSLVPLLAVVYSILSAFPSFQEIEGQLRSFIFSNFVPASGEVVQDYLLQFTQHSSRLTSVGIVSLIVTALVLLQTIDTSINRIWRTNHDRPAIRSFMIYWVVLSLGPLLLGVVMFTTTWVLARPQLASLPLTQWLQWLPFLSSTIFFAMFYMMIPNRLVPFRHALVGGLLAAILFSLAKKAFAIYAIQSNVYETIYGAMSVFPLFLIWIYVSWVVILLGAEVTSCLGVFNWRVDDEELHESDNRFLLAFRLLGYLWQAQCEGKGIAERALYAREPEQPNDLVSEVLVQLEQHAYVGRIEKNHWILLRDLGEVRLVDLYRLLSGGFSNLELEEEREERAPWSDSLYPILARLRKEASELLDVPLKTLYQAQDDPEPENVIKPAEIVPLSRPAS